MGRLARFTARGEIEIVDVIIELSGNDQALNAAVPTAAYGSRVIAARSFQGPGTALTLGDEFHHNRVHIVGSQISGVAPRLQHRWDGVRMLSTVLATERHEQLGVEAVTTHVVDAEEAPGALRMLDAAPERAMQVVLDYGGAP